ncbi:MAG: ATP-binding protein [Gracilibacteraceae bacterium]|jgi:AAA+ ATPase superfamily predicted ATPase|nr:ATP-binding protein [Gracilibacteraceae bacterium]
MFVGRSEELKSLTEYYGSGKYECAVIYGRRRVGKTELITEFVRNKKHIYFTAVEGTYRKNLEILSKAVFSGLNGGVRTVSPVFSDFSDCLDYIHSRSREKLVVVFDEYPYFAQSEQSVSSVLQQYIDHKFQRTDIMFILCGSSMSFMERQVMGNKSPLYGRRTCQYKLLPFDFKSSAEFHSGFDKREQAVVYGITGGIPKYLLQIDDKKSLKENITKNFFSPDSLLFEEPSNLLKQELREPAVYNAIITAIAAGSSKLNEIATKSHMTTSACSNYLTSLISLNIVRKELPILAKANARNTIYRLNDGMFRFWYKFVYDNISAISMHHGEAVYDEIAPQISDFMGEVFEDICKQWLWRENFAGRLPFRFKDCGRWWGTNPHRRAEQEIDLLAYAGDKGGAIFCECKWTNEKIPEGLIDELINKSDMFSYEKKYYYLFSKSGFTPAALARASDNVRPVCFDDMFSR